MPKPRLHLLAMSLLILLGFGYVPTEAAAQIYQGPTGDWSSYGGSRETRRLDRENVIIREGSCPTGGCILKLDQVEVRPSQARPGETLTLTTVYTILTPEQAAIPVTITREIFFQEKALGQTKNIASRVLNGSWTQEIDFKLPADARPGVYTVRTKVSTGYGAQQKDATFEVY